MRMANSLSGAAISLAFAAAGLSAHAQTESIEFTTTLPDYDLFEFYSDGDNETLVDQIIIEGLPKFDASLGTLVDVKLSFFYDLGVDVFFETEGILNTGVTHTASFSFFQVAVGITYAATAVDPPTFDILGDVDSNFGVGCVGNPGDGDACSTGIGTGYAGSANEFSLLNGILLSDFIGTGDYTGFNFEVDLINPMFSLFNVGAAYTEFSAFQDSSNTFITIEYVYTNGIADTDGDGVDDEQDNCVNAINAGQTDVDADGYGNACDADVNNDCVINVVDLGALRSAFFSSDPLLDFNSDGVVNVSDLGIMRANFFGVPGPAGMGGACDVFRANDAPLYTRDAKTGLYR